MPARGKLKSFSSPFAALLHLYFHAPHSVTIPFVVASYNGFRNKVCASLWLIEKAGKCCTFISRELSKANFFTTLSLVPIPIFLCLNNSSNSVDWLPTPLTSASQFTAKSFKLICFLVSIFPLTSG